MAVTFVTETVTIQKLYMKVKGRRYTIDRQIMEIEYLLDRWDRVQKNPSHDASVKTISDCVQWGGQPFLEARAVVVAHEEEICDDVPVGSSAKPYCYVRRTYTVTSEADVRRCLQELIDARNALIGPEGSVKTKTQIKH